MQQPTTVIAEGAELLAESGKTYLAVSPLGQANVWTAVDKDDHSNIVVLKAPAEDDTGTSWPAFQHEMIMHELLKNCTSIRKQIDRIAPVPGITTSGPPLIVLEIFETTLWHARTKRPFSRGEIRSVARAVLRGLQQVHNHGLVYADLKMQNIMLNGFSGSTSGDGSDIVTKLGDLGIVMEPARGKVQPVAYRAPEVFFKGEITQAADIWAFGLIYCHLLEAQTRFSKTGLYDDLYTGSGTMMEREQAMRFALANDYDIESDDYYKDCALPYRDANHDEGNQWEELRKRGLEEREVEFLQWVLKSNPEQRPTAQEILDSHWLNDDDDATIVVAKTPNGAFAAPVNAIQDTTAADPATLHAVPGAKTAMDVFEAPSKVEVPMTPAVAIPAAPVEPVFRPTVSKVEVATIQPAAEPAFTPTGSGGFDWMLEKRAPSSSPIKEHPFLAGITDAGYTVPYASGEAENEDAQNNKRAFDNFATPSAETGIHARPTYLGRYSSAGGTYLSYR